MQEITSDKANGVVNAAVTLMNNLSMSKIAVTFIMAILGVAAFTVFENRLIVFQTLVASVPLMASVGVGVVVTLIGWAFAIMFDKVERTQLKIEAGHLALLNQQRERIIFLEGETREDHRKMFEMLEELHWRTGNVNGKD
jgi:hypothetical protein